MPTRTTQKPRSAPAGRDSSVTPLNRETETTPNVALEPSAGAGTPAKGRDRGAAFTDPGGKFFRQMVVNLRNGVLAITRDGRVAVMNETAYRVLGLRPRPGDVGRPFGDVLRACPEVTRLLSSAFD